MGCARKPPGVQCRTAGRCPLVLRIRQGLGRDPFASDRDSHRQQRGRQPRRQPGRLRLRRDGGARCVRHRRGPHPRRRASKRSLHRGPLRAGRLARRRSLRGVPLWSRSGQRRARLHRDGGTRGGIGRDCLLDGVIRRRAAREDAPSPGWARRHRPRLPRQRPARHRRHRAAADRDATRKRRPCGSRVARTARRPGDPGT